MDWKKEQIHEFHVIEGVTPDMLTKAWDEFYMYNFILAIYFKIYSNLYVHYFKYF